MRTLTEEDIRTRAYNFGRPPVSTIARWMPFGTKQRKSY
jgi:hypothetical protein